jgi:hypothetical protein
MLEIVGYEDAINLQNSVNSCRQKTVFSFGRCLVAGVFGFVAGSADVSINLMRNMAVRMDHAGPLALGFAWVDREGEFHQENRSGPNALQLQRLRYFYGMPMGLGFMERQEGVIARHRTVSQPIVGDGLALVF